jgi:copper chaperone
VSKNSEELMIKKTYKIPDMHCSNCAMKLESIEDDLPGIREINASYHKQLMIVEFDEAQVSETQILVAIAKKGYQAEILS